MFGLDPTLFFLLFFSSPGMCFNTGDPNQDWISNIVSQVCSAHASPNPEQVVDPTHSNLHAGPKRLHTPPFAREPDTPFLRRLSQYSTHTARLPDPWVSPRASHPHAPPGLVCVCVCGPSNICTSIQPLTQRDLLPYYRRAGPSWPIPGNGITTQPYTTQTTISTARAICWTCTPRVPTSSSMWPDPGTAWHGELGHKGPH